MARILMGWELGANRGHILRLLQYHDAFVAAGHHVTVALQRIDGFAVEGRTVPGAILQAPLWPRLLATAAHVDPVPVATLGDILARLGLADRGAFATMLGAWDRLLAAERPDLVVADFAPVLLSAARGRLPTISIGHGFDMPPGTMPGFPSLSGGRPLFDEAPLLAEANAGLAAAGRPPLDALPGLFAADHELAAVLPELDPYAAHRRIPPCAPALDLPLPPIADGGGDELFVYWPERAAAAALLWDGLERAGMPIRMYVPRLDSATAAAFEARGFTVEAQSMKFDRIAVRARMVLSHGGVGFTTMALLVGLPQAALHYDLEKRTQAIAIERLGVGMQTPLGQTSPDALVRDLRRLWEDRAVGPHARALAAELRARLARSPMLAALDAVDRLLGESSRAGASDRAH